MIDPVVLRNGPMQAEIAPQFGGSVLRLDYLDPGMPARPILKPWGGRTVLPNDRAMFVMAPWCNRIFGGGFAAQGKFHPIEPNVHGQPNPIHGYAFQEAWDITEQTPSTLCLALDTVDRPPFKFSATLSYALSDDALITHISVTHRGAASLPYGLGFHPWLSRSEHSLLRFSADGVVALDAHHEPMPFRPFTDDERARDYLFRRRAMNATFVGWDGRAALAHPDGSATTLESTGATNALHVYTSDQSDAWICLEPVSHTVDAHNRPHTDLAAPTWLESGSSMSAKIDIRFHQPTL